jgi:hypothetical protein
MNNGISTEQRIAAVLAGDAITSADLSDLIVLTNAAVADASATAEAERSRALDPANPVDPSTARAAMEDAALVAQRMRAAMPRSQARLDAITAQEYAATWSIDYAEVEAVRDALAAEVNEIYPTVVATLTDLLTRISTCDREIGRINGSATSGERRRLRKVELEARGLDSFTRSVPPITDELRLPQWEPGGQEWPPPALSFNAAMAAAIAPRPFNPRYSADWHKVKAAEAEAQREQHRLETEKREAEANANWRGPKWWEGERA